MSQQYSQAQQPIKMRTATVILLKGSSSPIILYLENPQSFIEEVKKLMKNPTPVLIEKDALGPIKKVCFMSNQITGIILQDEQYT